MHRRRRRLSPAAPPCPGRAGAAGAATHRPMFRSDPGASPATPPVGPSPQSIVTAAVGSPSGEEDRCRAEEVAIAVEVPRRTRHTALVVAAGLLCGWWITALTPFS